MHACKLLPHMRVHDAESEGGEPQSPAPKKTRRGKRGGRNQKMRAESMKRQPADELARSSLEFATVELLRSFRRFDGPDSKFLPEKNIPVSK